MADDSQEVADIIDGLGDSPAPLEVYNATRDYDTRYLASAGAAAAAGGAGGGGSQPTWEAVTVPTDELSWRALDNPAGNGNWSFVDGVITFTNEGGGGGNVMMTTTDNFGQAWAVETEVQVPDENNYQFAFNAAAWLDNAASAQELDGVGLSAFSSGPFITPNVFGQSPPTSNTVAIPDTDWHTIRAIILPLVQQIYFDGTLICQTFEPPTAAASDGLKESRFLLYTGVFDAGLAFRNLKAWRIPMPTFPA